MSLNNFNCLNSQNLILNSIIYPEKDKTYEYLKNYFELKNMGNCKIKEMELIKNEKIYHDMIINPTENNFTRIKAWIEYSNWVKKIFGPNDIRAFMLLENFTRSSSKEKDSNDSDFCKNWALYMEKCSDWEEVVRYMKKFDLCTKNFFFYYAVAISYEKEHNFTNANLAFLEGLDKKVNEVDLLQIEYKKFEDRMEGRITREINTSQYSTEAIYEHIEKELRRKNAEIFNENNKRLRNYKVENLNQFATKKRKIEQGHDSSLNSVQYGQVPIFIDEPFRKNIITNATKLVEKHNIMMKFLIENDIQIKLYVDQFNYNLVEDKKKKPVSWINGLRMLPNKISNINENISNKNVIYNLEDKSINLIHNDKSKVNKQNKKVDEIMDKLIEDINKKNDELKDKGNVRDKNKESNNINNANITINHINSKDDKSSILINETTHPDLNKKIERIEIRDGKKYKIVKIEKPKKEEVTSNFDHNNILFNKQLNKKISINNKICRLYLDKLKVQQLAEDDRKNRMRRKTIIYKVDSDGEVCMSSDEDNKNVEERVNLDDNKLEKKNEINVENKKEINNNKSDTLINAIKNLNLFECFMPPEEINEKIKEVTSMYFKGMINVETRDLLYNHLEEKITQIEMLEKEKKASHSGSINSFKELNSICNNNQSINPFLVAKKDKVMKDIFTSVESVVAEPKKTIVKHIIQGNKVLSNNIVQGTHHPLLELPNAGILKKNFDETPFSNISRSLDFTNIKILESNTKDISNKSKQPLSSIFFDNNLPFTKNPFFNDKKFAENISISFDSDHSHLFQQIENSVIREEECFDSFTPKKDDTNDIIKTFNIKDTPQLLKKIQIENDKNSPKNSNQFLYNNSKSNLIDFHDNKQLNAPKMKNIYNDFNSINQRMIKESNKQGKEIKQEKLSKLFGDAFCEPNINNHFGLSSITEKTLEKSYLSDDSFIFKK